MTFQEQLNLKNMQDEIAKLKKENVIKEQEIKNLKNINKDNLEVIHDLDVNNYRDEALNSRTEIKALKKKVESLLLTIENYKNNANKNSSNSLQPSSTDGFKHVIQNNREKTDRRPGRQKGYIAPPPKYIENPNEIVQVSNNNSDTCSCGGHIDNKEIIRRQVVSIEVKPVVQEHRGHVGKCNCCGKEYNPVFPVGVNNPINYDNSIKKLLVYLNTYNNVPERGITNFISFITNGKFSIAPATVINTVNEFSNKAKPILLDIKEEILKSPVINDDETPIKVGGKENSVLGVFTDLLTLLEAHPNRTEEAFVAMNILNIYTGISVHDHNNMHKKFLLSTQSECNFHPLRKAKEQLMIHGFKGITDWIEILIYAKEQSEIYKELGLNSLPEKLIQEIKDKYLNSLDIWDKEHNKAATGKSPNYFDKSRCLKARLREFVDDHLRFLSDFRIPFTNNLAERGLRPIKTKQKIGNFRSLTGAMNYCDARSIIDTAIKQKVNVGSVISDILDGITNVFEFQNKNNEETKEAKVS